VLALAPLWLLGMFARGLWTPDEPREADIAWRMSLQSDRTLPQLAGRPFLEKPPLSYWMSAATPLPPPVSPTCCMHSSLRSVSQRSHWRWRPERRQR